MTSMVRVGFVASIVVVDAGTFGEAFGVEARDRAHHRVLIWATVIQGGKATP